MLRIARAPRRIAVAVTVYHRQARLVMLLAYHTAGIHAEGAHFVLVGVRIVDQLRLVKILGQMIHDRVGYFYAHANVHFVVLRAQPQLLGLIGQPFRAAASGSRDHMTGTRLPALALPGARRTPTTRPFSTRMSVAVVSSAKVVCV